MKGKSLEVMKPFLFTFFRLMQWRNLRTALFWFISGQPIGLPIGCPETSVRSYHYSLRNNPQELGNLK